VSQVGVCPRALFPPSRTLTRAHARARARTHTHARAAGGRNAMLGLRSASGYFRRTSVVGLAVFTGYWYWYPLRCARARVVLLRVRVRCWRACARALLPVACAAPGTCALGACWVVGWPVAGASPCGCSPQSLLGRTRRPLNQRAATHLPPPPPFTHTHTLARAHTHTHTHTHHSHAAATS
jgi:hypothetical protein